MLPDVTNFADYLTTRLTASLAYIQLSYLRQPTKQAILRTHLPATEHAQQPHYHHCGPIAPTTLVLHGRHLYKRSSVFGSDIRSRFWVVMTLHLVLFLRF